MYFYNLELVAIAMLSYMDDNYKLPDIYYLDDFIKMSFRRWAVNELIDEILDDPWNVPERTIQRFSLKMKALSKKHPDNSVIFETAVEVADELYEKLF